MGKEVVHHHIHYEASGKGFKDIWNKVKHVAAPVINKVIEKGADKAKDYAQSKAKEYGDQYGVGDLASDAVGKLADTGKQKAMDKVNGSGVRRRIKGDAAMCGTGRRKPMTAAMCGTGRRKRGGALYASGLYAGGP